MKTIVWIIIFHIGFIVFPIRLSKLFLPTSNLINTLDLPFLNADITAMLKLISWTALQTSLFIYFDSGACIKGGQIMWTAQIAPVFFLLLSFASLVKTGVS